MVPPEIRLQGPEHEVQYTAPARLPTRFGSFYVVGFRWADGEEHLAITKGDLSTDHPDGTLVRLHSKCVTGDVLHSLRCDCGAQLHHALASLEEEGRGVLVYLDQEGRGIGLYNKIRAYVLQDEGSDTVDANRELGFPDDARDYRHAVDVLRALGVERVRLLTNNPDKVTHLREAGVDVVERVPIHVGAHDENRSYLEAKRDRMGHLLDQG